MIRVWLVDGDAALRREIAVAMTQAGGDVRLTRSFGLAAEALRAVRLGEALDAALIDLELPDIRGEDLMRELRRRAVRAPLVAFTDRADDDAIFAALRAGAHGYLTKDASVPELLLAVRSAISGAAPLSPQVSRRVVSSFWSRPLLRSDAISALTAREREILEVLCTGASYREVGSLLGIAGGTVQTHVKRIYEKLAVRSKAEAVRMALEFSAQGR